MRVDYICETCGKAGHRHYPKDRLPGHFFCSRACQNKWQKTREDLVLKNKDPEFRKKVSEGLKRRKLLLGDNYHSAETKEKIGKATVEHWNNYDDMTRERLLKILNENAQVRRTYQPYDFSWQKLSKEMRKNGVCHRCGSKEQLAVHHIIPVKAGGSRESRNLVTLCPHCHAIVENQTKKIFEIIPDWNITQILIRERLHCV